MFFDKVAIVGIGLLGGSVGHALKVRGLCGKVVGLGRSQSSIEAGLRMGAIDEKADGLDDAVRGADLVVVCTPVASIAAIIAGMRGLLDSSCIVTDVGSTKQNIVREVEQLPEVAARFVGSHPLAGSEKKGVEHASADIFEGATVFLTPSLATDPAVATAIREMWKRLGSHVVDVEPALHDRIVAYTSHLPHVIAALLVGSLKGLDSQHRTLVGKGFLDSTRIASSDPEMWANICISNPQQIQEALLTLQHGLEDFQRHLRGGNYRELLDFFQRMKEERDGLSPNEEDD